MRPNSSLVPLSRRGVLLLGASLAAGCRSPLFRGQSPEPEETAAEEPQDGIRLVGDLAAPVGLSYQRVDGVALVNELRGTGSDPPTGPLRQALIDDMKSRDVANPNEILASSNTSLVQVRGFIPPGARVGDRFDVEVDIPRGSETSSLRGGWMMQVRLRELAVLGGAVHSGLPVAVASGPVIVDSLFVGTDDPIDETRGRVLGGAEVKKHRTLGLAVRPEFKSVQTATRIGNAINRRFSRMDDGIKKGVANPTRDNFIQLEVEHTYKHNLRRYLRIVRSIAVDVQASDVGARLPVLEQRLLEPTTAARTSLQLEAIGTLAIPVLKRGITSPDPEVQFYSAEALAYLDVTDAAGPLAAAARNEPAFRWHALTALSAMSHLSAYEALSDLLHVKSAETRYGAFRALLIRNANIPTVQDERLSEDFHYHVVASDSEPMVHFSRSFSAEVVLFGHEQPIRPPQYLFAGKSLVITGADAGQLKVSRIEPNRETVSELCPAHLDALVRTIHRLGGGYGEIMEVVQAAKASGDLNTRIVINAMPQPDRAYQRSETAIAGEEPQGARIRPSSPVPEMFANRLDERRPSEEPAPVLSEVEQEQQKPGFFGRMKGWFN